MGAKRKQARGSSCHKQSFSGVPSEALCHVAHVVHERHPLKRRSLRIAARLFTYENEAHPRRVRMPEQVGGNSGSRGDNPDAADTNL